MLQRLIDRRASVRFCWKVMSLSLVVLAAGMGSRYGGLKQIDPVGPGGETVLDYAVFDARRAGFDRRKGARPLRRWTRSFAAMATSPTLGRRPT